MHKLILNPNISVGPFVFGVEQKEIWRIMKEEFGSEQNPVVERELPDYESEYYENLNINFEYKDNKLISVMFIDDIRERYCEIYLGNEKIWPRTEKKFLSIFGRDSFVDVYGSYYHTGFSLAVGWDDDPPSLTIGQEGYSAEIVENYKLFDTVSGMEKGMNRNECRAIIGRTPNVSADGRTDTYSHGVIRPEIVSLTFDSDNKLITVTKRFPDGDVLNILD